MEVEKNVVDSGHGGVFGDEFSVYVQCSLITLELSL